MIAPGDQPPPQPHHVSIDYAVLEALQEREQHLAEAQRVAHIGSWEWDVDNDSLIWSDELYRVFGLQVQELEPTYEGWLAHVHPDDREEQAARVAKALEIHEPFDSFHRVMTVTGTVKWVHSLGEVALHADGRPKRLYGTAQEVTRQVVPDEWGGGAARVGLRQPEPAPACSPGSDEGTETSVETIAADSERAGRLEELRHALGAGQFLLHYQPKILLANDRAAGVEALVRWEHPTRGLVAPDRFIPLAEETGFIVDLGAWVLEEACRQAVRWQALFPDRPPLVMAVNLSPRQFRPELVATVADVLARTGVAASALCLEVTESIVMADVESTIVILGRLKDLGVAISIDDFGTGYSSLAYLRRFPLDELKIDRSFVDGLGRESEDTAIVAAVVAMAHALELEVVAEGVETKGQLEHLRVLGCEQVQGYYFSRPLPAGALEAFLVGEDDLAARHRATPDDTQGGYHGEVVVIADDSPEVLHLAAVSLRAAGFEVHQADNGRSAVALAQAVKPACVVLDVRMPDLDGFGACRALRADPSTAGCTIVMLTANADAVDKVEGFSAGADDYIVKPFAPRDLVGRVRAAIRRRQDRAATPAGAAIP